MESPLRFQAVVAVVAIGGAVLLTERREPVSPVITLQDAQIDESSGLVDRGDTLLTVNDSGDGPVVYVVDTESGATVGRTTYTTDSVVDVEALAEGPGGSIWVGDIGDNSAHRMSVAVYELPPVSPGDRTVTARRYDLQYRNGPRDAEALLVHPATGQLYVASKGLFGGQLFAAPVELRADEPNVLAPIGRTGGLVTDGAFFPDGRHVLLRSYSDATVYDAERWRSPAGMSLPDQRQGEGLAMTASGRRVLISTEGRSSKILSVTLSPEILAAVTSRAQAAPAVAPEAAPQTGSTGRLEDVRSGTTSLVALTVAVLAAALGVRALLRFRASRRRSRHPR